MPAALIPREERWRAWLSKRAPKLFLGARVEPLPVIFDRKRIYTLPTRFGFFFGAMALLCVFGGLNYNNNVVLMLAFLVAALGFVSLLYAFLNLRDLSVISVVGQPAFLGELVTFQVLLQAPSVRDSVVINYRNLSQVGGLDARTPTAYELLVPTERRGVLALPAFRVWTDYPFGLFYAWSYVRVAVSTLVYPKPEADAPVWPNANAQLGAQASREPGDDDLVGLKDYVPGDRAQRIAWAVYARSDELSVRDFRRAQSKRVNLDLADLKGLSLEAALSRLCAWVLRAESLNLPYSLKVGSTDIPAGLGRSHRERCLECLALHS